MRAVDIIAKKREGQELTSDELKFFVDGYVQGSIPNYKASAWCIGLDGGRRDPIDYEVGIVLHAKIGTRLSNGDPLLTIHTNDSTKLEAARQRLLAAVSWSSTPVAVPPHALKIIH